MTINENDDGFNDYITLCQFQLKSHNERFDIKRVSE